MLKESLQLDGKLITRALAVFHWQMEVSWIEFETKERLCDMSKDALSTKPEVHTYSPKEVKYLGNGLGLFRRLWSNRHAEVRDGFPEYFVESVEFQILSIKFWNKINFIPKLGGMC